MQQRYSILLPLLLLGQFGLAQGKIIDRRDQAEGWYLPVICTITANGGKTSDLTVLLYKDNEKVAELQPTSKSAFELQLDINAQYTIHVSKPGYREKTVYLDASLPTDVVQYTAYKCFINLEPMDKFAHSDPFYLDFPSAVVRWNEEQRVFTHNDSYLANIQLKMALLGAQMETN
jgi:hypothetical protein